MWGAGKTLAMENRLLNMRGWDGGDSHPLGVRKDQWGWGTLLAPGATIQAWAARLCTCYFMKRVRPRPPCGEATISRAFGSMEPISFLPHIRLEKVGQGAASGSEDGRRGTTETAGLDRDTGTSSQGGFTGLLRNLGFILEAFVLQSWKMYEWIFLKKKLPDPLSTVVFTESTFIVM